MIDRVFPDLISKIILPYQRPLCGRSQNDMIRIIAVNEAYH